MDADNTKNNPSTDQNAAGSTTDSSMKDSKKDDSVSTLLIPEQWNIEIANCIPTDSTSCLLYTSGIKSVGLEHCISR